jgi:hypothetical protein
LVLQRHAIQDCLLRGFGYSVCPATSEIRRLKSADDRQDDRSLIADKIIDTFDHHDRAVGDHVTNVYSRLPAHGHEAGEGCLDSFAALDRLYGRSRYLRQQSALSVHEHQRALEQPHRRCM